MFDTNQNPAEKFQSMIGMAAPLLKMANIDLETIIPETAKKVRKIQDDTGKKYMLIMGLSDVAEGFDLGFFQAEGENLVCVHRVLVTDVASVMEQLSQLPHTIANLNQENNATEQNQPESANEPAASTEPDTATARTTISPEDRGSDAE